MEGQKQKLAQKITLLLSLLLENVTFWKLKYFARQQKKILSRGCVYIYCNIAVPARFHPLLGLLSPLLSPLGKYPFWSQRDVIQPIAFLDKWTNQHKNIFFEFGPVVPEISEINQTNKQTLQLYYISIDVETARCRSTICRSKKYLFCQGIHAAHVSRTSMIQCDFHCIELVPTNLACGPCFVEIFTQSLAHP